MAELRSIVLSSQQHDPPLPPPPIRPPETINLGIPGPLFYKGRPGMPSPWYRRKLRQNIAAERIVTTTPRYISLPCIVQSQKGECDIDKIHQYFYTAIDMIIQHMNFTETVSNLNAVIQSVKSYLEYYTILDTIEQTLLSTAVNIIDGASVQIITERVAYVKTSIDSLPPLCQERGHVSDMILQILDTLIQSLNTQSISGTITQIQTYVQDRYGHMSQIEEIQTNLLSVVDSLGSGTSMNIISMRVEFIRELLAAVSRKPVSSC